TAKPASRDAAAERLIKAVCQKLIALEEPLNALDAKAGDGDTGSTVATGARSILERIDTLPLADRAATAAAIGDTLGTSMGGSSGVLLSIFFTAASQALGAGAPLTKALLAGLDRMTFYGGAKVGDRTMVDALEPALKALDASGLEAAAKAARQGAEATAAMQKAKAGRSAYIGRQLDIADPGAFAVAEVFAAVAALFAPA
ncbi:MAG: DAK2 domain-containing protein, partial [Mesorhizobium sp.]